MIRRRDAVLLGLSALLVLTGVLLFALPFVTRGMGERPQERDPLALTADQPGSATAGAASSVPGTSVLTSVALTPTAPSGPPLNPYRGLGSWVDIYDTRAWKNPRAAVDAMSQHGVRTLFVETANSSSRSALNDPSGLEAFIREAHSHGMSVVAWYLPDMKDSSKDYSRIAQAIRFRTSDGQKFDSFALDIESTAISSESARNHALCALSTRMRALVGPAYALGAIIPSPTGLAKKLGYWDAFPYTRLAQIYDVFVPMSYFTYHGNGNAAAYADTVSNVRIIRAQKGCSQTPIHLIGGIADDSSAGEVQWFVRGVNQTGCIGASLYSWPGTTGSDWQALSAVKP